MVVVGFVVVDGVVTGSTVVVDGVGLVGGGRVVDGVGHPVNSVVFRVGQPPAAIVTLGGGGVSALGPSVVVGRVFRKPPGFVGNTGPTTPGRVGKTGPPGFLVGGEKDAGFLYPGGRRLAGISGGGISSWWVIVGVNLNPGGRRLAGMTAESVGFVDGDRL